MLVDVPLDGRTNDPQRRSGTAPHPEVTAFLDQYPTAKIVVVIDTHCLQESGAFIWTPGTEANPSYEGCSLWEVSCPPLSARQALALTEGQLMRDCLPKRVVPFLNAEEGSRHHHRSIIINLACGAVVRDKESRHSLSDGFVHSFTPPVRPLC